MAIEVFENYFQSYPIHYVGSTSDPCHSSVIAGNWTVDDGNPASTDLIQLDAVSVGVIVPVRRNGVAYNNTTWAANTFHFGTCERPNP